MPDLCNLDKHNKHKVNSEKGNKGLQDSTQGTTKKEKKLSWTGTSLKKVLLPNWFSSCQSSPGHRAADDPFKTRACCSSLKSSSASCLTRHLQPKFLPRLMRSGKVFPYLSKHISHSPAGSLHSGYTGHHSFQLLKLARRYLMEPLMGRFFHIAEQ